MAAFINSLFSSTSEPEPTSHRNLDPTRDTRGALNVDTLDAQETGRVHHDRETERAIEAEEASRVPIPPTPQNITIERNPYEMAYSSTGQDNQENKMYQPMIAPLAPFRRPDRDNDHSMSASPDSSNYSTMDSPPQTIMAPAPFRRSSAFPESETLPAVSVSDQTPSPLEINDVTPAQKTHNSPPLPLPSTPSSASSSDTEVETKIEPINTQPTRPIAQGRRSSMSEDELLRVLSRRRTGSNKSQHEETPEMEALLSRIFGGDARNAADEKTRHVGVVFKNLIVKGQGIGAAIAPTVGDVFAGPVRKLKGLFNKQGHKSELRTLINDFTGCIEPGEMLLVLGRPGSGCSTFLKTIGNQHNGFESVDGTITYGGVGSKEMAKNYRGEILYNPEEDLHYATLTVKNTLQFALKMRTPGKASRKEGQSRGEYVQEFLRVVSKIFWIEHTMDTKVGNEYIRGVSGGEKKRVSIAEAMVTKSSTQCWDNSTRGLDSSTAVEYVQSLRTLTNMVQMSTLVALYQAGESLYDMFDKVLLIDEGRCAYYGPTDKAKAYFEGLGFECSPRWTTADFLTSVTDIHERKIRKGYEDKFPRNSEALEKCFRDSQACKENLRDVEEFESRLEARMKERDENEKKALAEMNGGKRNKKKQTQKNYTLGFGAQVVACTRRQFLVMMGDPQSLVGKWGGILFQAIIVGSLFYNLPPNAIGVFPRGGVLFFALLFNALLALAELTSSFSSRPILLKHKSFTFYRPSAYALAQVMTDIPMVLVQVLIFDIIVYFMSNLSRTAGQFFISLLTLFLITMSMYSFFRMIGSLSGSLDAATRVTGVAIQALVVYTGYLIPPSEMRPWLMWLRYINPVAYGFEALMANEFAGLEIECVEPFLVPAGPNIDPANQSCLIQGSQPGSSSVSGSDYIDTAYTYKRSHLWRNVGIIIAFWLFFVFLTCVGMELQKPNKGGAAATVYKRGRTPKSIEKALDNGSSPRDEEMAQKEGTDAAAIAGEAEATQQEGLESVARNEAVFTFQNVNYEIPVKGGHRKLLQNVNGLVRPGKLTALMGGSGAGKTTLLNTLAQRIDFGTVSGTFLVDGRPLPKSFQRATGFAEQEDVHEPTATVREALRFSAKLRQPKEVPLEEKYAYVETVLKLLEMEDIAGAIVGVPGNGLNQEQRKRLTIGVELASKPELLMFLDEPTSGLDSGAAFNIVRFLRKLADAGQAILCTIHQPSAVLFEHFDELILLEKGGRVVYQGPLGKDSRQLIDYFESNGGKKCPKEANPAEYMLEVVGVGGNNDKKERDWGDVWQESETHKNRVKEIEDIVSKRKNKSDNGETRDDREYAMPWTTQVHSVVHRTFVSYWRNPDYLVGKFMLHIFTGLFNMLSFLSISNSSIGMQSRLFSVFMTLTISPPLIQQLQPRFLHYRNIYRARESSAKIYHWTAFVIGAILVEIPYSLVAGTIYFQCWYWGIGYPRDSGSVAFVWGCIMLFELFYVGFGQAIASLSPNELLASLLVPMFFTFVVAFCGVVVPYAAMPKFWRSWMYHLTPFRYLLEAMLGVLTHNVPIECAENEFARFPPPDGTSCQEYVADFIAQAGGYVEQVGGECRFCQYASGDEFAASFNVFYRYHWRDFGIFCAYIVFNFAMVFVCTWLFLGGIKKLRKRLAGNKKSKKE